MVIYIPLGSQSEHLAGSEATSNEMQQKVAQNGERYFQCFQRLRGR